jgi:hypothetical protein
MVVHFHRGEVTPRNAYIDGNVRVGMRQEASEGLSPGPCPFGEGRTGATAFEASTLCVFSYRHCLTITGPGDLAQPRGATGRRLYSRGGSRVVTVVAKSLCAKRSHPAT